MYIMSQDGRTVGEYQLVTVKKMVGKRFGLYGHCHTGNVDRMLADPPIGEYDQEERARQELEAVFAAMERGDRTYRLK